MRLIRFLVQKKKQQQQINLKTLSITSFWLTMQTFLSEKQKQKLFIKAIIYLDATHLL